MPMPAELRALMERYNRIGCLLDSVDEDAIKSGDPAALASAKCKRQYGHHRKRTTP